jgi:hypothetical protein
MEIINLKNFQFGGLADSKFVGKKNSFADAKGIDLHSKPGLIRANQRMTDDSQGIIDDLIIKILPASDGNTYLFGKDNGKVWKRSSTGLMSLVHTNSEGQIIDGEEFDGYIYYASSGKLGRKPFPGASDWSDVDDTWATFDNGDGEYHPMRRKNQVLFIGDGYQVAQVETTFTSDALVLEEQHRIASLGEVAHEVLIGTYVNDNVNESQIFRWNSWSEEWTTTDPIYEVGVNAFIPMDNVVFVQGGRKGSLYFYNGRQLEQVARVPGDWSGEGRAYVRHNAVANLNGLPLFGMSNDNGNPISQGVYSYGGYARNYPNILNFEYELSCGNEDVTIGAMKVVKDVLLVGWQSGSDYGLDKLDLANKESGAYITTRVITRDRSLREHYRLKIPYYSYPEDTEIKAYKSVNYGDFEEIALVKDDNNKMVVSQADIHGANTLQVKIEFITNANETPEIESIILETKT